RLKRRHATLLAPAIRIILGLAEGAWGSQKPPLMLHSRRRTALVSTAMLLACVREGRTQELEPRAYSAAPVGTNFLITSVSTSRGEVGLSDDVPIQDLHATIGVATLGYAHSF